MRPITTDSLDQMMRDGAGQLWSYLGPSPGLKMVWRRLPVFRSERVDDPPCLSCRLAMSSPPLGRTPQGNPTELLADPVLFSQGELTRIASSLPAQMDLIDRHVDISAENGMEASLIEQLEVSAGQLQEAAYRIEQLDLDLGDTEIGLKITVGMIDQTM